MGKPKNLRRYGKCQRYFKLPLAVRHFHKADNKLFCHARSRRREFCSAIGVRMRREETMQQWMRLVWGFRCG